MNKILVLKNNKVYCQSGALLFNFCRCCIENSFSKAEPLYGIPGTVGGAVFMNAGAYGTEIKDLVENVWHINSSGKLIEMNRKSLDFSYRHSVYENTNDFIFSVVFSLEFGSRKDIEFKMQNFLNKRKKTQPLNFPNAGSIFKRPKEGYAAKIIEECGLKGAFVGGAKVSEKHSGFIVNVGGASCFDVKMLSNKIKDVVRAKKFVDLETEIRFID